MSATENSNKFQKTNQLRTDNTWRLTIQFKHEILSYLAVQKIDTYIAKQCSHVELPYFVMGSHFGLHTWADSTSHTSVYKVKGWAIGEHICFYFQTLVQRGTYFYWGVPNVPKILMMRANQYWLLFSFFEIVSTTHELIKLILIILCPTNFGWKKCHEFFYKNKLSKLHACIVGAFVEAICLLQAQGDCCNLHQNKDIERSHTHSPSHYMCT
jgi:hypothetical protein